MQTRSPIYLICTTPRSGSNLLCEQLESTGILGRPREYFNGAGRRAIDDPEYPDAPEAQVRRALDRGVTANGVFGVKLFASQMPHALASETFVSLLDRAKFLYLRRDDLLGQAISLVRAQQSGQFRASQKSTGPVRYNARAIERALEDLATQDAAWRAYFHRCAIAPIETTYDAVVCSPREIVDRLARELGLVETAAVRSEAITLLPQSDAISQEWRRQFIADHGDRGRFEVGSPRQRAGASSRPGLIARVRRGVRHLTKGA